MAGALAAGALAAGALTAGAAVLAARLAGAEPLAACLVGPAGAFLAGVLVAVRFTGWSVAGLALVAATYTLSVVLGSGGRGRARPKASAMRNIGVLSLWISAAIR